MMTFETMDLCWSIICSTQSWEHPPEDKLKMLPEELANRLRKALNDGYNSKAMESIQGLYWKLHGQRKIFQYIGEQSRSAIPRDVVIENDKGESIYYSNWGEPIKRNSDIKYIFGGDSQDGILKGFKMTYGQLLGRPYVSLWIFDRKSKKTLNLFPAYDYQVESSNYQQYFDNFIKSQEVKQGSYQYNGFGG